VYPLSMDMFGEDWNKSQFWVWLISNMPASLGPTFLWRQGGQGNHVPQSGVMAFAQNSLLTTRCVGLQYSDETAAFYARQLLEGTTSQTSIAVVSTPSVFVALKNILVSVTINRP
jgi:hypothetical protein